MISAVVDTNVLLRGAISGSRRSASKDLVNAFFEGRYLLFLSRETFQEIQRVLAEKDVRAKHGWSDEKIKRFCRALEVRARFVEPKVIVSASVTRDATDTKFLALAEESNANYLVTKDNRHLLRLKRYNRTRIVTPAQFLRELS